MTTRLLFILGVMLGGAALLSGLEYYVTPLAERPFSPLHELYAPTGLIGQGLGIVGTAMMLVGVTSYALRKRVRALSRFGTLRRWLQVHIFLCLLGPFFVLLHTTFKFGGLVAISFWSMALVVGSGVFGRWVYVWIPKTQNGRFLGREEIRAQLHETLRGLEGELNVSSDELLAIVRPGDTDREPAPGARAAAGASPERRRTTRRPGILGAALGSVRYRLARGRERSRFHRSLAALGVPESARPDIVRRLEAERRIEQQLRLLQPFQAAFRYWHAFHLPLAGVMLLVLVLHVGVAVAFGYTWIWSTP